MKTLLDRCTRKVLSFSFKLNGKVRTVFAKPATATVTDPKAARKAHFEPFCQVTTASGTEWACNGNGEWQLLEANGIPLETAMQELFEQMGVPVGVSVHYVEHQVLTPEHIVQLAALYRLGFCLSMEYFKRTYGTKDSHSDSSRICRAECQGCKPKSADGDKASQHANSQCSAFQRTADCFTNFNIHASSSTPVTDFGISVLQGIAEVKP